MSDRSEKRYPLDDPSVRNRIFWVLVGACVLTAAGDFVVKHSIFFGFYCIVGFVSLAAIVFGARVLRRLVMRSEDYYDR